MTGYGSGEFRSSDYIISVTVKSYNNRYLDIATSLSPALMSYEEYVIERVKEVCKRGHVEVSVFLKTLESRTTLSLDKSLLLEYKRIYDEIAAISGCEKAHLSDYANVEDLVVSSSSLDSSYYKEGVDAALSTALGELRSAKEREGGGTKRDLEALISKFSSSLDIILSKRSEMESYFKKVLIEKYEELLGEKGKDDPRFLSEVAALLVKYSINEECSRLSVHLSRYKELLEEEGPVGKELDFLCQEMNREINTTASKSQMVEINLAVVKMKDALEDIREQVRNIE